MLHTQRVGISMLAVGSKRRTSGLVLKTWLLSKPASDMQALYQPQDNTYFNAASELLEIRNKAIKEELELKQARAFQEGVDHSLFAPDPCTHPAHTLLVTKSRLRNIQHEPSHCHELPPA